jgi:hypothetical protein
MMPLDTTRQEQKKAPKCSPRRTSSLHRTFSEDEKKGLRQNTANPDSSKRYPTFVFAGMVSYVAFVKKLKLVKNKHQRTQDNEPSTLEKSKESQTK